MMSDTITELVSNVPISKFLRHASDIQTIAPQLHETLYQKIKQVQGREQMLEHLKALSNTLESKGIDSSYYELEDEAGLCWFDKSDVRNSISLWLDDSEGVWSCAKDGKTLARSDFKNTTEFLAFSL